MSQKIWEKKTALVIRREALLKAEQAALVAARSDAKTLSRSSRFDPRIVVSGTLELAEKKKVKMVKQALTNSKTAMMYVVEGSDSGLQHAEYNSKNGASISHSEYTSVVEAQPKRFGDMKHPSGIYKEHILQSTGPKRKCQVTLKPNGGTPEIKWEEPAAADAWSKPKMVKQPLHTEGTAAEGSAMMYVVEGSDTGRAHGDLTGGAYASLSHSKYSANVDEQPKRFGDMKHPSGIYSEHILQSTGPRRKCQVTLKPNGGTPEIKWEEPAAADAWSKPKMVKQPLHTEGTAAEGTAMMYVVEGSDTGRAHSDLVGGSYASISHSKYSANVDEQPKRFGDMKHPSGIYSEHILQSTGPRRKCQVTLKPNGGTPDLKWEDAVGGDAWTKPKMVKQPLHSSGPAAEGTAMMYVVEGSDTGRAHGSFNIPTMNASIGK